MNRHDPEALRQAAQQARETARRALDSADALDITANLLDRLVAAEVDEVLARTRLEAARRAGDAAEVRAAREALLFAQADMAVFEAALEDPMSLEHFTGCDGWKARLARPEVYRRILKAHAEGMAVSELVYAAALTTARAAVRLDRELIGETVTA